jgi:hypothetical protein
MVVSQLLGGLGNQLFQYAMGRAIATRNRTCLKLDISKFDEYRLRPFALRHFAIEGEVLTLAERRRLGISAERRSRLGRLVSRLSRVRSIRVVRERAFGFDPAALNAAAPCYLEGYWQSPKYFAAVEEAIRKEFRFREALTGKSQEAAAKITDAVSVSVHVRRGDYASNVVTNKYHGTCSPEYYAAAECRLLDELGALTLFIFSDDPDWAEHNLRFKSRTVLLRHNGPDRDYDDLHLMTLCRHHILANSTFSWWGAWLCQAPGKLVIAPKTWFRDPALSADDLLPTEWIRM